MKKSGDVKQQAWGQVSNKHAPVHRPVVRGEVVVPKRVRKRGLRPHGFQGPKWLIEKAKIALSTAMGVLYYYDQVERLK